MKRIRKFTEKLSVEQAKNIFGITSIPGKEELKALYKKLSRENHPDLGGSDEKMRDINAAYDILEPMAGRSDSGSTKSKFDWEAAYARQEAENTKLFYAAEEIFSKSFDAEAFEKWFLKFIPDLEDQEFVFNVKRPQLKNYSKQALQTSFFSYSSVVEFYNKEKTTFIALRFDIRKRPAQGGALSNPDLNEEDLVYKITVSTNILFDGRKYKIYARDTDYRWRGQVDRNLSTTLMEPEETYPAAKMKKIFSNTADTKRKFSKQDWYLGISRRLDVSTENQWLFIYPFGKENKKWYLVMSRFVMQKIATWGFNNVVMLEPTSGKLTSKNRFKDLAFSIYETEENLDKVVDAVKEATQKCKGLDPNSKDDSVEIFNIFQKVLKDYFPE